ncbi:phytoene dehydrogenase [Tumebacillus flagellatus]|uniref:Phytoene dehydrogenase n=2 Tax=Tumebacillus flagellatus TaxID=1157490 RepID=A0A074LUS9_9BACL|nr:phytoene dehydrogenase [Tumebacillus flagellatus]
MQKQVVILGGGVAGMTAAHELMERGFRVTVYEFKGIPGGKARSIPKKGTGTGRRADLPGEHGFRFFPGFYRHVPDTMKRIPFGQNANGVFDNLVYATRTATLRDNLPMVVSLDNFPRNLTDMKLMLRSLFDNNMGLTLSDIDNLVHKTWQMLTSCDERKTEEYEKVPWWQFVNAEQQTEAFQHFMTAATRVLVAAKSREASAKTIGNVFAQLCVDLMTPGVGDDRLLNGPTNDVWIEPWLNYLREGGVEYHMNAEVKQIHCENGEITGVTISQNGQEFIAQGDYYVSALPVEIMAQKLTDEMLLADPTLHYIKQLASSVAWMNGIQYFLTEDLPVVHGHLLFMDAPWALTAVSQAQFWPDFPMSQFGDGHVKGILSVDVSDWETPGVLYGKTAMECTAEEIKNEVWEQMKRSINQNGDLLRDEMLHDWFLDPDIQFENPAGQVETNLEPLLVNKAGTWDQRPDSYTQIRNFFLASDYVRTNTDLATMEGANEAARRAVNSILNRAGSNAEPCEIFTMYEPDLFAIFRHHDRKRFNEGLPWDGKFF